MLSRAITRAIAMADPPERRLYRWPSGRWGPMLWDPDLGLLYLSPWVGTRTIHEMVRLGLAEVTERRRPGWPIVVRIVTRRDS